MRYNKKTFTVITDGGPHWNVAPKFLRKTENLSHPRRNPIRSFISIRNKH